MTQPVARRDVVRDVYFGTTIADPYRWMEDWKSAELQAWIQEQAEHTRHYLDALPHRATLLQRITELSNAGIMLTNLQVAAGRVFYLRRDPGDNLAKLVTRREAAGQETVLLDPNAIAGEAHTAIDWYAPSLNGRYVAYGISEGGSEDSTLHVLEVDSGTILDDAIEHAQFGGVYWLNDNTSFVYNRFPERAPNAPVTDYYMDGCMYLHRVGSDKKEDITVFGPGVNARAEIARTDHPFLILRPNTTWMLGMVQHGDLNELTLYAAPRATLSDPAHCPWTKIVAIEDEVTDFTIAADTLYLKSHKHAPRYQILALSLKQADIVNAPAVVPESQVVIEEMLLVGDYLLIKDLDGGLGRLRRLRLSSGAIEEVSLPMAGRILEWAAEPESSEALFKMVSWTDSPRFYHYDLTTGAIEETGWLAPFPIDFSDIEAYEVHVTAKDGVRIPLSILHSKDLKLDGSNPTILMGYGSYGISMHAFFDAAMMAWYERGGVYAIAHMRGGGEYGDAWHKAGQKLNKQNTIDDFIACAEYLIEQQWTRPERLAGQGGSAGGIPSGGALVKRPDLWAVMLMHVAVTNALRAEFSPNGPPNIQEFGSVTTEDGFKGLQIIDSYSKIRDGENYPAVMLTTGMNDPRVVVWQATKMAARLQAATASGKPILLRVDYHGGHGMGSTRRQLDEELADVLAFLLEQMKV